MLSPESHNADHDTVGAGWKHEYIGVVMTGVAHCDHITAVLKEFDNALIV